MNGFSVNLLCYGNHTSLAKRCLGSLVERLDRQYVSEIRVGLNEVSHETYDYVYETLAQLSREGMPTFIFHPKDNKNVYKYPLVRKMFYAKPNPIVAPFVMWWDDDSALVAPDKRWWADVYHKIQQADMLGDIWWIGLEGKQREAIKRQPWYKGKPWRKDKRQKDAIHFATGGWWCIRTSILQKWDWPFPEIQHNGGDRILGELIYQQGLRLQQYREHLWINADANGKQSGAKRRGISQSPLWKNFDARVHPDLSHQDFEYTVIYPGDNPPPPVEPEPVESNDYPKVIELPGF